MALSPPLIALLFGGGPDTTPEIEILWDDNDLLAWDDGDLIAWDS